MEILGNWHPCVGIGPWLGSCALQYVKALHCERGILSVEAASVWVSYRLEHATNEPKPRPSRLHHLTFPVLSLGTLR